MIKAASLPAVIHDFGEPITLKKAAGEVATVKGFYDEAATDHYTDGGRLRNRQAEFTTPADPGANFSEGDTLERTSTGKTYRILDALSDDTMTVFRVMLLDS